MADRSTITQIVQLGLETTPGVQVATSRRLQTLDFATGIKTKVDGFRPAGYKFDTVGAFNKEWTEAAVTGQPTYTEIVYPLSSVITTPAVPTTILDTAIDTGGRRWIFEPGSSAADVPLTFTVEQGSAFRAHSYPGAIFSDYGLNISRDKVDLTGKVIGQEITDAITLGGTSRQVVDGVTTGTLSSNVITSATASFTTADVGKSIREPSGAHIPPNTRIIGFTNSTTVTISTVALIAGTAETFVIGEEISQPLIPIAANQFTIYLDTTSAGLGTTKLGRLFSGNIGIGNRFGPVWTVDQSEPSWAATVETVPDFSFKMMVEADAAGMALVPILRTQTTYFMRCLATGPIIYNAGVFAGAAALKYSYQHDMAVQVRNTQDFKDEQGVYAIGFDLVNVHDATWGKACHVEVVNKMNAL